MRCAFCDARFRRNDLLPEFPGGRTLAFDPERNRLWTICGRCGQWNLASLDYGERASAVAKLDSHFRATPEHGGSQAIGVAQVHGVTLMRIGDATWREFAAWRYGRRLQGRFWISRTAPWIVLGLSLFMAYTKPGQLVSSLPFVASGFSLFQMRDSLRSLWRVVGAVRAADGAMATVRVRQAQNAELLRDGADSWKLVVDHSRGTAVLRGDQATRALAAMMPAVNAYHGSSKQVDAAIDVIERVGGPSFVFAALAKGTRPGEDKKSRLVALKSADALALEIAAQEYQERRQLQGEVTAFELEWRDAEAVARIAETL